jgi:hypothetical protein
MASPLSTFYIKQGDLSPSISEYLRNADGSAIILTGCTVKFHMMNSAGVVKVNTSATIDNPTTGQVHYDWSGSDTDTSGVFYREWEVTLPSGKPVTTPNYINYPVEIAPQIA